MKAKQTDKATVIVVLVGVAVYLVNYLLLLSGFLYVVFGSHTYDWTATACWLAYLAVVLVLGTLWRKKSWLIGVGISGLLGAVTLLFLWLNWSIGFLLMFLFLPPYSVSDSLWLVFPVAVLPWILLAAVVWREKRVAARVAPTIDGEN